MFGWDRAKWDDMPEHDRRMYLDELTRYYRRKTGKGAQADGPVGLRTRRVVQG